MSHSHTISPYRSAICICSWTCFLRTAVIALSNYASAVINDLEAGEIFPAWHKQYYLIEYINIW